MPRALNLLGQRFGKLLVIERGAPDRSHHSRWWCRCDCGTKTLVLGYSLQRGDTRSCGCHTHPRGRRNFSDPQKRAAVAKRARDLTITAALREQSAERRKSGKAASVQRQSLDAAWDEVVRNYVPPRAAVEYWGQAHD